MSTTTQRPTPETDAAIKKTWPADAISLAVKLERERDEAREEIESILNVIPADAPCLHAETGETVADYILDLQKEVGRVHALYFNDRQQHCNPMKPLILLGLSDLPPHATQPR
jgi:hypothetical protein